MGFRKDSYATIWEIKPVSNTMTQCRISIDRKNRETNEYEQEFGGYVAFVGTANAQKSAKLKEKDRIKLGDVDVTTKYDKEKNTTYVNYKVFAFDMADSARSTPTSATTVDSGEIEAEEENETLPF